MSNKHSGVCLCGQVRFEIEGEFDRFFFCHCERCRKGTGSAHGANLFSSTATLTWLAGQDMVAHYRVPESRHARSFCSNCGSPLPRAGKGILVVPAGSLESAVRTKPTAHIFAASRAGWDSGLEVVPSYEKFPL